MNTTETAAETAARVYVGTYRKYNEGSIKGAWIDLDGLDAADFAERCAELHADESDPELMFQDWEGVPEGMIGESWINPELWAWLEMDEDDRELLAVYRDGVDQDGTLEQARDAYAGTYESPEDWAVQFIADCYEPLPEPLASYFDYAAYARDARLGGDMVFVDRGYHDCWVFHNQ